MTLSRYTRGLLAETIAAFYLRCLGYHILHRRYRTKIGEADIVALKKNCLVFVEVKARKNKDNLPYTIMAKQRQNITHVAQLFLKQHPSFANHSVRFDALLLAPFFIKHIKNGWEE